MAGLAGLSRVWIVVGQYTAALRRLLSARSKAHINRDFPHEPSPAADERYQLFRQQDRTLTDKLPVIMTHHNTMIFWDPVALELRHGPPSTSPRNVHMAADERKARLLYFDGVGSACVVGVRPTGSSGTLGEAAGIAREFDIVQMTETRIGLASNGIYLCADNGNIVTLSRDRAGPWERFELLASV